ncbi:MAG: CPBP family intramembrane glutamic endopeptidase [Solirubrobacteraceae bacterium]
MDDHLPTEGAPLEAGLSIQDEHAADVTPIGLGAHELLRETDPTRSPTTGWRPWTAILALIGGLVAAAVGGLIVDLPASLLFGVKLSSSHIPAGLTIADTAVQDVAFVLAAVYCAQLGARAVGSWQFGLRRPGVGRGTAAGYVVGLLVLFILLSVIWSEVFNPEKEELLKQLGSNEGTVLLLASAALTCVVAPICEELLFRGYIFTALRNWKGTLPAALITAILFGGVHAGSAPALDLVPLAGLGFGLCMLYRYTGSLYPCIVAHSLNNSLAFSSLENWSWQTPVLMVGSLAAVAALAAMFKAIGLIAPRVPADA